jgi:hypothetical protein
MENNRMRITHVMILAVVSIFSSFGFAKEAKNNLPADTLVPKILNAIKNNDYNSFIANGDDQFKLAITKPMFNDVHAKVAPRLMKGYDVQQLGILNQQGCKVYLTKIVFKDGGDDVLTKLVLSDGKILGFWFQ